MDSPLFKPEKIANIEIRNRTIRSAAFEGMCPGGYPSDDLINYHRSLASGGIGMTTVAYCSVTRDGLAFNHQMWMRKEIMPQLKSLTEAVHKEGAAVSIQIGHCGNMADSSVTKQKTMAPSPVFNLFGLNKPVEMTEAMIEKMMDAFAEAADIVKESGFDAIELQAAHGYLISQFLSPYTNRRNDRWGGNIHNRARFLLSILKKIRKIAGNSMAVIVKINMRDGFKGGMEIDEALEVARMVENEGADAIFLSAGFVSKCPMYIMRGDVPLKDFITGSSKLLQKAGLALFGKFFVKKYPFVEGYLLDLARNFRKTIKIPLIIVGGFRTLKKMEEACNDGFNFIAMARPLIKQPDFINLLRKGEITESSCEPCNRCVAAMYHSRVKCYLNDLKIQQ